MAVEERFDPVYAVRCDECDDSPGLGGFVVFFEQDDYAVSAARREGWRVVGSGGALCPRCHERVVREARTGGDGTP